MNTKYLIVTVVEMIIKVAVLAVAIVYIFRGATFAYEFGYRVFADEPVSVTGGRTITVSVGEGQSVKEIAQMLEERGLIEDANLFVMQELLSAYHGDIVPGIYDLSTAMTAAQMLEIMSTPSSSSAEDANEESGEEPQSEEEDAGQTGEDGMEPIEEDGAEGESQEE